MLKVIDDVDDKIRKCMMVVEGIETHSEANNQIAMSTKKNESHIRAIMLLTTFPPFGLCHSI